ncbi:MAG TPA: hypothetical protein VHR45_11880 [Thermoanaerobaculia bacterium]|nr:hypothetical protein [Thermoanaerobaculia bacterium]
MRRKREARGWRPIAVGLLWAIAAGGWLAAPCLAASGAAAQAPPSPTVIAAGGPGATGGGARPASALAPLVAQDLALYDAHDNRGELVPEEAIRRVESEYVKLLNRNPDDGLSADALSDFYSRWGWVVLSPSPEALGVVAGARDPVRMALRLAPWPGSRHAPPAAALYLAALAARPEPSALWLAAAEAAGHPAWNIALAEQGVRRLTGGGDRQPDRQERRRLAAAAAELELGFEIDSGLLLRAAARLKELPQDVLSIVESGETGHVQAQMEGMAWHGELRDARLDLTLLRFAAGDVQGAARLLASLRQVRPPTASPPAKGGSPREAGGAETAEAPPSFDRSWRRLLELRTQPSRDDPYEIFVSVLTLGWRENDIDLDASQLMVAAAIARREGYGPIAAYFERRASLSLQGSISRPAPGLAGGVVPAPIAAAVPVLSDEIADEASRLEESARQTEEERRAELGPDPAAPILDRLLREPSLASYAEHALPAGIQPLAPEEAEKRHARAMRGVSLPERFEAVRVERAGWRAAAIGVSQDYDWVGPGSPGAYWVILSSDGGATWSRPLYTGLRANQPYVVRQASRLPLLAGARLQVEVEVRELAAADLYWPRGEVHPLRTASGLYLDIPLELLQRDSDGDGLTDLAEERLLTDPFAADTDHDGFPDGQDPLPQIASAPDGSAASLAMAALFENVSVHQGWTPYVQGPIRCCSGRPALDREQTSFWTGDRQLFTAVVPYQRIVVLNQEELARAEEKFGPFTTFDLDLLVLDRGARHGFAIWSAPLHGALVRLEEREGVWYAEEINSWLEHLFY